MGSVFVDLLGARVRLYGACERIFFPIYTSSYLYSMLVRKGDDSLAFKVFALRVERASTLFVNVCMRIVRTKCVNDCACGLCV